MANTSLRQPPSGQPVAVANLIDALARSAGAGAGIASTDSSQISRRTSQLLEELGSITRSPKADLAEMFGNRSSYQTRSWTAQPLTQHTELPLPLGRVRGLQKWEGEIVHVGEGVFTADLSSLDRPGQSLEADFPLDLLPESERHEVVVGRLFYLTVRTVDGVRGGRTHTSSIKLRRLGVWTTALLEEAKSRGVESYADSLEYLD